MAGIPIAVSHIADQSYDPPWTPHEDKGVLCIVPVKDPSVSAVSKRALLREIFITTKSITNYEDLQTLRFTFFICTDDTPLDYSYIDNPSTGVYFENLEDHSLGSISEIGLQSMSPSSIPIMFPTITSFMKPIQVALLTIGQKFTWSAIRENDAIELTKQSYLLVWIEEVLSAESSEGNFTYYNAAINLRFEL